MAMPMITDAAIVIIGGSVSSLMHALVLKALGYNIHILESRSHEQMHARAAGLSLWPNAQMLIAQYAPDVDLNSIAITNSEMQIMNGDGIVLAEVPVQEDVRTSSWAVVHSLLKEACGRKVEGHGIVRFEAGRRVSCVREQNDLLTVTYEAQHGSESSVSAKLVIAADGSRSAMRSQVLSDVKPEYVGYLAWRGSLSESNAPDELKGVSEGKLSMFMFDGGYLLAYLTPNESGSMSPGKRLIEWCWYDHCDAESSTFTDFMTDIGGKQHNVTIPAHILRPETWKTQLSRRRSTLSALWYNLFAESDLPLLTAIHSFENSKASLFHGKMLLVGEAFTQIRPHLGASCDISALQALLLGKVLTDKLDLNEWETTVAKHANEKGVQSKATGIFGMTGQWPEGLVPSYAKT